MSEKILIAGAGICGLCTAMALSGKGREIILIDGDSAPPDGDADAAFNNWNRQGAAQFRHPHAFLGLMCNLIKDNYPDLLEMFYDAGARHVGFEEMVPPELKSEYSREPGDDRLWLLMCRRALMETVMRRYAIIQPGVKIMNQTRVRKLLLEKKGEVPEVTGLTVECNGELIDLTADVVVDASGRTSKFKAWLEDYGVGDIEQEVREAEIVYYTRHYRLRDGQEEPPRGKHSGAGDLGYLKFGVFPGDQRTFAVIVCLPDNETELKKAVRDGDSFDRICRNIPGLIPWLDESRSVAITDPFGIGDIISHWRHYVVDDKPLVMNFFAVGDAAIRTNPLYGRGCSLGIMHAQVLAGVLETVSDPFKRAIEFDHRSTDALRPIYDASVREDRTGIKKAAAVRKGEQFDGVGGFKPGKYLALAMRDALSAASRSNMKVFRGVMRTFHLLEKPGEFFNDWRIRLVIVAYMLRGRSVNTAKQLQAGPDRSEMLEILTTSVK
jgi:2-polyprenyl-6-methoxyphenol hydroxylase-like FAD-dependent oxidoreductase